MKDLHKEQWNEKVAVLTDCFNSLWTTKEMYKKSSNDLHNQKEVLKSENTRLQKMLDDLAASRKELLMRNLKQVQDIGKLLEEKEEVQKWKDAHKGVLQQKRLMEKALDRKIQENKQLQADLNDVKALNYLAKDRAALHMELNNLRVLLSSEKEEARLLRAYMKQIKWIVENPTFAMGDKLNGVRGQVNIYENRKRK